MATKVEAEGVVRKLAGFYGLQLDETFQVPLYTKCLEPYPVEILNEALNRYVQDTANDRFPIPPNKIVLTVTGNPKDDDATANDVATRIRTAIGKFGCAVYVDDAERERIYTRVREYVGEVAWKIVEREGGWRTFCIRENTNSTEPRIAHAQLRDMAKSILAQSRAGVLDKTPSLPMPTEAGKLKQSLAETRTRDVRKLATHVSRSLPPEKDDEDHE